MHVLTATHGPTRYHKCSARIVEFLIAILICEARDMGALQTGD
jgi:hypothetical protein